MYKRQELHHLIIVILNESGDFGIIAVELGDNLAVLLVGVAEIRIVNKTCIEFGTVIGDNTDILGIFTGGCDKSTVYEMRFAVIIEDAVAVTVDPEVDIDYLLEHIGGTVGGAGNIIAEVSKADDDVAAELLQLIALCLCNAGKVVLIEIKTDNIIGVGLGNGFGGSHTEYADGVFAAGNHDMIAEYEAAVLFIGNVCGKNGEIHLLFKLEDMLVTIVEIMVAGSHCAVTDCVHDVNCGFTAACGHDGKAVKGVACIKDEDGSARILVAVCKICLLYTSPSPRD